MDNSNQRRRPSSPLAENSNQRKKIEFPASGTTRIREKRLSSPLADNSNQRKRSSSPLADISNQRRRSSSPPAGKLEDRGNSKRGTRAGELGMYPSHLRRRLSFFKEMLNFLLKRSQLPEFMSHRDKYLRNRDTGTTDLKPGLSRRNRRGWRGGGASWNL